MIYKSLIATAVVVVGVVALGAQDGPSTAPLSPEVELKTIRTRELLDGDMSAAVARYQVIADRYRVSRPEVAAEAGLQMARGISIVDPRAGRAAYESLLLEFGDVPAVVAAAWARLGREDAQDLKPRRLTSGHVFVTDVNADGREAVGVSLSGDLWDIVRLDLSSGDSRVIVSADAGWALNDAVLSRDGRQVAFRTRTSSIAAVNSALRIVSVDGGTSREVLPPRPGRLEPIAWSPDGRSVLVGELVRTTGAPTPDETTLDWVSVQNGSSVRVASFPAWRQVGLILGAPKGGLSPDGAFIAFSAVAREGGDDRHLFVMDARGGNEVPLVEMAGNSHSPVWSPDGDFIFFESDRSGNRAVWAVPIRGGRATGEPVMLRPITGRLLGMSTSGDLIGEEWFGGGAQIFIGRHDSADRATVTGMFPGSGVAWSGDGASVAYLKQDSEGEPTAIVVRAVDSGRERTYAHDGLMLAVLRWIPGTSSILLQVREAAGSRALYVLDTARAQFSRLMDVSGPRFALNNGVEVSPDGRTLFLVALDAPAARVVAVNIASGSERAVAALPDGVSADRGGVGLAASPNGATLALKAPLVAPPGTTMWGFYTAPASGGSFQRLGEPLPNTTSSVVRWSRDGTAILFFARERGAWRLMRMPLATQVPVPTALGSTTLESTVRLPAFLQVPPGSFDSSPDESRFAFSALTQDIRELWSFDNLLATMRSR